LRRKIFGAEFGHKNNFLPILSAKKFVKNYPQSCQFMKIIFDNEKKLGAKIAKIARENPLIFFYHISNFYVKIIKYWCESRKIWSQPIFEAEKKIKKNEKIFWENLKKIANSREKIAEKILAAKKLTKIILQNLAENVEKK